jgi:uncharacterized protein
LFDRILHTTIRNNETSFLWGPRQSGKSTLLKNRFASHFYIDLLRSVEFRKYITSPQILADELRSLPKDKIVVIDEIQRVPELLNEVHHLIESEGRCFVLSGSSARKLKRGQGNLLGGRAIRHEMFGLVFPEITSSQNNLDIFRLLNHGYLPRHYLSSEPNRLLKSYISDYLKEEIAAEGLTRNLPAFSDFLRIAALMDTEIVNFANVATECGVSQPTVKSYFEILIDTLLGRFVPAFSKSIKRRVIAAPKFYFADVGVVHSLVKRGKIEPKVETIGPAFENYICHELHAHRAYRELDHTISYWRTANNFEVDFILDDGRIAVEVKAKEQITRKDFRGLQIFAEEFPNTRKVVVSLVNRRWTSENNVEVFPVAEFLKELWDGNIV